MLLFCEEVLVICNSSFRFPSPLTLTLPPSLSSSHPRTLPHTLLSSLVPLSHPHHHHPSPFFTPNPFCPFFHISCPSFTSSIPLSRPVSLSYPPLTTLSLSPIPHLTFSQLLPGELFSRNFSAISSSQNQPTCSVADIHQKPAFFRRIST